MDEKTVTMMEGVAREWRVRVKDSAGNVLNPEGFSFYGGAADGMQVPRRMQVRVEGDVAVLRLPGLWMSGRCWRYQVMCQDVLTGVEWVLCQGDVVLERRVACNGPALHEDAVLVDAVLDSELEQVEVVLGDSTAASAEAARRAEASREAAEAEAARAGDAAAKAEDLKRVALDAAAGAALSAEGAADSKRGAEEAAVDAAADAQLAEVAAAEAEVSREAAEAAAKQAGARAAEAEAGAKVATEAVSDALAARDEAVAAQRGAEAAQVVAEDASAQAGRYAEQAVGASDGAVVAQGAAEAAKVKAEAAADEAEQNAALLGDAALRGAANVFTADNTFEADIIGGLQRLPANCLAAIYYAALHWWNNEFDWYKTYDWSHYALSNFPNLTHLLPGTAEPDWTRLQAAQGFLTDCPLAAIPDGWTGAGLTREGNSAGETFWDGPFFSGEYLPDSWLTPDLVYANGMYSSSSFETLPEGTTFEKTVMMASCFLNNKRLKYLPDSINFPKNARVNGIFQGCVSLERLPECMTLGEATTANNMCWDCKKLTAANEVVGSGVKGWWASFRNCNNLRAMHSVDCSAAVVCEMAWYGCQLDKESALRILSSLPAWGDEDYELAKWPAGLSGQARVLHIGIHKDLKQDDEILAALELAALPKADGGKGWRVSYTWEGVAGALNAAAAASTYGMRELIYARVREVGDARELEWAHGVLDPDGRTPEELGYEVFRSEEAAREYFGMPEKI